MVPDGKICAMDQIPPSSTFSPAFSGTQLLKFVAMPALFFGTAHFTAPYLLLTKRIGVKTAEWLPTYATSLAFFLDWVFELPPVDLKRKLDTMEKS